MSGAAVEEPRTAGRQGRIRERLLDAAADLFLERGYEGVSVDAITQCVGGSKSNVYTQFGGKQGLLAAVVERECARVLAPLSALEVADMPVEAALERIGAAYLGIVLDARTIALHRLAISIAPKFPHLAAVFFERGPEGAVALVSRLMRGWADRGLLAPSRDPLLLARQFLEMLKIRSQARLLLGLPEGGSPGRRTAVREAVSTFLHGCVAPGKADLRLGRDG